MQTQERTNKKTIAKSAKNFLAAIDPGNQNIDVIYCEMSQVTSRKKGEVNTEIVFSDEVHVTIPSQVCEGAEQYTMSQNGLVDGTGDTNTREYGIGNYPGAMWIKDSLDGKAQWVLPALIHTMWEVLNDGDSINVIASVHNAEAWRDEMKRALNGSFTFVRDDVEKTVSVKCDRVLIEGIGVLKYVKPSTIDNLLLDLGGQTIMLTPYSGLKLMPNCTQPYQEMHQGTSKLIAEFAKCPQVNAKLKRVMTYQEARSVIDDPSHVFQGHDFSNAVREQVDIWLTKAVGRIESNAASHLDECKSRYATGGACLIPSVREWLINRGYAPVADPLSANVRGLFALAQGFEVRDAK